MMTDAAARQLLELMALYADEYGEIPARTEDLASELAQSLDETSNADDECYRIIVELVR